MSSIVYNIPPTVLGAYRGRDLIVRSDRPEVLLDHLGADDIKYLAYVQLCSLPEDIDCLIHWSEGLAIDLVLSDPLADFAQLYRYAKLLDNHPVRVSVPVVTGFDKAVRLALSLQFAVKLEVGQPDARLVEVLAVLLDAYLHRPTVSQPIEPFHSLLLAFLQDEPVSLWAIQEEDPALVRLVDEHGEERLSGKLADVAPAIDPTGFVERWGETLVEEGAACAHCDFFRCCGGYFKWPQRDYDCSGVKGIFETLQQAGADLRRDLAAIPIKDG